MIDNMFWVTGFVIWVLGGLTLAAYISAECLFRILKYSGATKMLVEFWRWQKRNENRDE